MRGAEGLGVGIGMFSSFNDRVALGGLNAGEENPDQLIGFAEHQWQRGALHYPTLVLVQHDSQPPSLASSRPGQ